VTPSRHSDRGHQLRLLLAALRRLTTDWWRVEELAEDMGIGRRTAYRIVRELVAAELPLETIREGREVSYRLAQRWWERESATPRRGRATARGRRT
jgi:predicted DNA-binding transcriptional regulator YafY